MFVTKLIYPFAAASSQGNGRSSGSCSYTPSVLETDGAEISSGVRSFETVSGEQVADMGAATIGHDLTSGTFTKCCCVPARCTRRKQRRLEGFPSMRRVECNNMSMKQRTVQVRSIWKKNKVFSHTFKTRQGQARLLPAHFRHSQVGEEAMHVYQCAIAHVGSRKR